MNMILSAMSLDNLFLSLILDRPMAEKMCSDGTDVARTCMAIIEILEYFVSFFFRHSKGSVLLKFWTFDCIIAGTMCGESQK